MVKLDAGGQYKSSKVQRWLWGRWLDFWNGVGEWRQRDGLSLVVILNGELADDNKHTTTELVSRNPADQLRAAVDVLGPMRDILQDGDRVYVTRGTEAHSGPQSSLDELMAKDTLGVVPFDATKGEEIYSHQWLRLAVDGVTWDVAHHPPGGPGRVPWTKANYAARLAAAVVLESTEHGERPPDLYVRGHVHRPGDSYDAYSTRALILPSWQLTGAHGHRLGSGHPLPVGAGMVVCDRGRYEVFKRYWNWPLKGYTKA